jgi:hypothetical protein
MSGVCPKPLSPQSGCPIYPVHNGCSLTLARVFPSIMDRDFANAVINFALSRDPERVAEVITEVASQLQAKGYSAEEIAAAIDELVDELNGQGQPRH